MIFLLLSLVPALALLHPAATNQTKCPDSWLSNAAAGNRLRGKEKELHKRCLPTPSFLPHHFPFMASTCSIEGETDADVTPGFSYFSCRVQILLKRTKGLQRKGGEEKWDIVVNSGRVKTITMSLLQHFFFFFGNSGVFVCHPLRVRVIIIHFIAAPSRPGADTPGQAVLNLTLLMESGEYIWDGRIKSVGFRANRTWHANTLVCFFFFFSRRNT